MEKTNQAVAANESGRPIIKESKRSIKMDFDRTPLKDRLKAKFLNMYFVTRVIWYIFRLVLLIGISYIVLYPFFTKIAGSFMAPEDFVDVTVRLIPKHWTLDIYKAIITELDYFEAFLNSFILSGMVALMQTFICSLIGYGLAKFRFKGNKLVFMLVILTMVVPHQTLQLSMFMNFRFFDVFGILSFLSGGVTTGIEGLDGILSKIHLLNFPNGLNLTKTYAPLIILSMTGLAFKNGLYVFMMRQFFTGIPESLEESAYIDGSGTFRTFLTIILPMSIPMMITIFLFAFCWQWTDDFYTSLFYINQQVKLLTGIVEIPPSLKLDYAGKALYEAAIRNTCGIMIILPLIILYIFCQNFLVQGIERSGITGE